MNSLLGEVVCWEMGATEVTFQNVVDSLNAAGLNPDSAREIKPQAAFTRACKHLKEKRTIDKLGANNKVATFQFTRKEMLNDKLAFDYECKLDLDTTTGDICCVENPELEETARDCYAHATQTRNANDITRIVQQMFREHADLYPISPKRGVAYFVPDCHKEFTAKVEKFLKSLGGQLLRFPVPSGTPEGNTSVKEAVQSGLSTLLEELNIAVANWDTKTRKATMERAMAQYEAIQYKVDAYSQYLESEQDRLKDGIQKAKEEMLKKISELHPDEECSQAA